MGAYRDLKFYEVVAILKAEEKKILKSKGNGDQSSSSVFLATQKFQDLNVSGASTSTSGVEMSTGSGSFVVQQVSHPQLVLPVVPPPQPQQFQHQLFHPQTQMFQPQFPTPFSPQSGPRFHTNNRNRPRGQGFSQGFTGFQKTSMSSLW